jgi:hypothetical protein
MPTNRLPVNKLFCFADIFAGDFINHKLIYNRFKVKISRPNRVFLQNCCRKSLYISPFIF